VLFVQEKNKVSIAYFALVVVSPGKRSFKTAQVYGVGSPILIVT